METQFETIESQIKKNLKNWWIPLLIGVLLITTALWTFSSPLESFMALSVVFSVSFLTSGILETYFSITNRKNIDNWGWNMAFGIITTMVGVLMLVNPNLSMVTLPLYVGFVALFRSIMAIGWATNLNHGELMVIGLLAMLFSIVLIWNPFFGGMTIVFWTGLAFLMAGIFSSYLSLRLKKEYQKVTVID